MMICRTLIEIEICTRDLCRFCFLQMAEVNFAYTPNYDIGTRIYGAFILFFSFILFSTSIYALVFSKLMPDTNNKVS